MNYHCREKKVISFHLYSCATWRTCTFGTIHVAKYSNGLHIMGEKVLMSIFSRYMLPVGNDLHSKTLCRPLNKCTMVSHDQNFFGKNCLIFFFRGSPLWLKKQKLVISISIVDHLVYLPSYFVMSYHFTPGLEVYQVSLRSRSLPINNMHLGKMNIISFSPILWSLCAY